MADSDHSSTPGKSPAFQFYPKDFLGDGDQAGMSLQETGAYARLMCYEWNSHGDGIPDDAIRAANMVHAAPGAMRKMWPAIRSMFVAHPTEPGRLVHPRLEKERAKQNIFRRRQSDASKKRWSSRGIPTASSGDIPLAIPKASSPISDLRSSDSSQLPRKEREGGRARDAGLMAGSRPINHGECLVHGPVCFRPRFSDKYLPRFGGNHAAMLAWATGVCEAWSERVHNGENVPHGDDFAFWAAAYDEHFKPALASGPNVSNESIAAHITKSLQEKPVRNAR
jgi:uncharacterized protein YdaU (DUF1376 family)